MKIHLTTEHLHDLKQRIEWLLKQEYLMKYLGRPEIDRDKLVLLTGMYLDAKYPKQKAELFIFATMFVQCALDTHDLVFEGNLTDSKKIVQRQLTVLGGDYFSSLYYQMLAKSGEVEMIATIAKAIREVNENKMRIYLPAEKKPQTASFIKNIQKMESALIAKQAERLELKEWKRFSECYFLVRRLRQEIAWLDAGNDSDDRQKGLLPHQVRERNEDFRVLKEAERVAAQELAFFYENEQKFQTVASYLQIQPAGILPPVREGMR